MGCMNGEREHPPPSPGLSGWALRATVTVHAVVAFGQPVFAGVYLTGNIGGLSWHATGADVVFSLGLTQMVVAAIASRRMRRWWPAVGSALILMAETGQYFAGLSGLLWLHVPLGVAIIASLAVQFVVVWTRPLRTLSRTVEGDGAGVIAPVISDA